MVWRRNEKKVFDGNFYLNFALLLNIPSSPNYPLGTILIESKLNFISFSAQP